MRRAAAAAPGRPPAGRRGWGVVGTAGGGLGPLGACGRGQRLPLLAAELQRVGEAPQRAAVGTADPPQLQPPDGADAEPRALRQLLLGQQRPLPQAAQQPRQAARPAGLGFVAVCRHRPDVRIPPPGRQERITLTLRVRRAVTPMAVTVRVRVTAVPGLG
jgi:hypothetical protein